MLILTCIGDLVTFAALIANGLGFDPPTTTLLSVPTGVIGTIWSIVFNFATSRLPGYRCILIVISLLFLMVSSLEPLATTQVDKVAVLGPYYAFNSYWGSYTMSTSLPMANTSGHTRKVTLGAMYFLGYCAGNIRGPQVFRAKDATKYRKGYIGLLASLIVGAVSISVYGILCKFENNRRDKVQNCGPQPQTQEEMREEAFSDKTDKEKLDFSYTY